MNFKCTIDFHKWDLVAVDTVFYTVHPFNAIKGDKE